MWKKRIGRLSPAALLLLTLSVALLLLGSLYLFLWHGAAKDDFNDAVFVSTKARQAVLCIKEGREMR